MELSLENAVNNLNSVSGQLAFNANSWSPPDSGRLAFVSCKLKEEA